MPEADSPELREVDPADETSAGTTALLQALMTMVGESLHRMELRLAALEDALVAAGQREPSAADELVETLFAKLDKLSERLERLERVEPPDPAEVLQGSLARLDELATAVGAIGDGVADIAARQEALSGPETEPGVVAAGLEAIGQRLERLEARDADAETLAAAMGRLDELSGAVDSIGYGLAGMADLMTAPTDGAPEWPEGLKEALVALGDDVADLRVRMPTQAPMELEAAVRRLEGQLSLLSAQMAAQPGPGAALAMVAAGLAERFEERTQALTDLLGTHAAYVRQTWERIESLLDGGSFDELAVAEALEHVIDNQEAMTDSVQKLVVRLEELDERAVPPRAAGVENSVAHEALASLGAGMEGIGARVDDVRRRLASLADALEASTHGAIDPEGPDAGFPLGRRASSAGRRLATDLGLRGRGRPRPPEAPPRP